MLNFYETREQATQAMLQEIKQCEKYVDRAMEDLNEGRLPESISILDFANVAYQCAEQARKFLEENSIEGLTEEERAAVNEMDRVTEKLNNCLTQFKQTAKRGCN